MIFFGIILIGLIILVLLWIFMQRPDHSETDFSPFLQNVYAHRGLYTEDQSIPENSLSAFRRAVEYGVGVELDIQLTADGQIVVFHDETLQRLCGINQPLRSFSYAQLQQFSLAGTTERIPLFSEVLKVLDGQVPMLLEYKHYASPKELCTKADQLLQSYHGLYCIESFHPLFVRWYAKNRPDVPRGQLAEQFLRHYSLRKPAALFGSLLMMNFLSKPQFLSYRYTDRDWIALRLCKKFFRIQMAYWTIRTQSDMEDCLKQNTLCIFEHFLPKIPSTFHCTHDVPFLE